MKNAIKWICGILLLLTGLPQLLLSPAFGAILVFIGLFLIPPILDFVEKRLNSKIPTTGKYLIVIGGLFLAGSVVKKTETSGNQKLFFLDNETTDRQEKRKELVKTMKIGVGQVLSTEYFDVVVNKITTSDRLSTGNQFADKDPEPGILYLIINVTYKNTDNESRMINEGSVFINFEGKEYEYDKSESIMLSGWGYFLDQINPLMSKTTNIVYKIPTEISGYAYYEPGRNYDSKRIYLGRIK